MISTVPVSDSYVSYVEMAAHFPAKFSQFFTYI